MSAIFFFFFGRGACRSRFEVIVENDVAVITQDTYWKISPLCSAHQDRPNYVQKIIGSGHDLELRSNLRLVLLGHIMHNSTRLDDINTMVIKPFS